MFGLGGLFGNLLGGGGGGGGGTPGRADASLSSGGIVFGNGGTSGSIGLSGGTLALILAGAVLVAALFLFRKK